MERRIDLSRDIWDALDQLAQRERCSVSALVQTAVRHEVQRRARTPKNDHPDEAALAPLRAHLADDFAFAAGWADLTQRLAHKGFALVEKGPGLVVVALPQRNQLCKASDLGYSHARLARRFAAPFAVPAQGQRLAGPAPRAFIKP